MAITFTVKKLNYLSTQGIVPECEGSGFEPTNKSSCPLSDDSYRTDVLSDSPIGYWRLGETESGFHTACDEVGNYYGVYVNGPTRGVPGLVVPGSNTAVTFNGDRAQYVEITEFFGVTITLHNFDLWFNIEDTGTTQVLIARGCSTGIQFMIDALPGGTLRYSGNNQDLLDPFNPFSGDTFTHNIGSALFNQTHHIGIASTVPWSSRRRHFVFDGNNLGYDSAGFQESKNNLPLTIGGLLGAQNRCTTGTIDEVAIYTGQNSASMMVDHYNAGT